jgi:uncharacterized RmlC-like cupin family protein
MNIDVIELGSSYRRENGLAALDFDAIKVPFAAVERYLYRIPSGVAGGNHRHPRWEAFVAIGQGMELIWTDAEGSRHQIMMDAGDNFRMFVIPPYMPHAVVNRAHETGVLVEWASEKQHDVQRVELISS